LIFLLMLGYRQLVVCQIAGDLPWFRVVDHVSKCGSGVIQHRRKSPPKIGHHLRSFTLPSLMEGHEAFLDRSPKMWRDCRSHHIQMILLRGLEFNTLWEEAAGDALT
jgi:hypothetical protein